MMVNPQDEFNSRHVALSEILLMKLAELEEENAEYNQTVDSDSYRQSLGERNPAIARWMEQKTAEERQEVLKQVGWAEAVAYTILWALDKYRGIDA